MTGVRVPKLIIIGGLAFGPGTYYVQDKFVTTLLARGAKVATIPPDGEAVGSTQSFEQTFLSESLCWTVNHNLGYHPVVFLTMLGGGDMDGTVQNINSNQLQVCFSLPTAGKVRCV